MFGLGMWEILIILALALIFIGPKKLPDLARSLGRGLREFRNAANEIRVDFQRMDEAEEERRRKPAGHPALTAGESAEEVRPADAEETGPARKEDDSEGGRS